jgi:glycosyltransferase involved in cell wall biosynthesis
MKRVCIIIPCYNEAINIKEVIADIRQAVPDGWEYSPVVVNDCSSDATVTVAKQSKAVVLDLPCNLGVGGAVQAGFKYALHNGYDYAVKFDGDGQHQARRIIEILTPLEEGTSDIVIGSRFCQEHDGFTSTPARMVGIKFFQKLNSFLTGQEVTDNTSGFRAYNREAIEFAAIHYPAFDYPEPEEVVLMIKNGFRLKEVFTEMQPRKGGESSINLPKAVYFMFKVFFAILMVAVRPPVRKVEK